ncbi:hypothetical protein [Niveibacterium sp.]|uniref:hypothetical protein n=1 Tax=Niveibacterium sp. TaxID=2017444 RepID=UPI0035AFE30A
MGARTTPWLYRSLLRLLFHGEPVTIAELAAQDKSSMSCNERWLIEWPPRSGRRQNFPEVDCAEWYDRSKMLSTQVELLDRLLAIAAVDDAQR